MKSALMPSTPAAFLLLRRFNAAVTSSCVMTAFRKSMAGSGVSGRDSALGSGVGDWGGFTGVALVSSVEAAVGAFGAL